MPIIEVNLIEGREMAMKHELIAALTEAAVRALKVPEASVRVLIREYPKDHWGIGGAPKP